MKIASSKVYDYENWRPCFAWYDRGDIAAMSKPRVTTDVWSQSYSRGYPCPHSWWALWEKRRIYADELRFIRLIQCRHCRAERLRVLP